MSNVEAMQKLFKAITGKTASSATVAEIISELADYYAKGTKETKKGEGKTA